MGKKKTELEIRNDEWNEKLKNYVPPEGHRFPMTRREFMAAGLIQGTAAMTLPTLASLLLPQEARAATPAAPAYFEVWGVGGAVFPANVAMTDINRQVFANYYNCGQGTSSLITNKLADGVTPIFANSVPMFNNSGFYASLNGNSKIAPILKKTYMVSIPASLFSDSASNIMSAQGLVQASVPAGNYMPYIQSGAQFSPSAYSNPPSPLSITDYGSLLDAVTARSTDTFASLPASTKASISKFIQQMSASQAQRYNSRPGGADLATATASATGKVYQLNSGAINISSFDPRLDTTMAGIWSIAGQPNSSLNVVEAAIAHNVAKGNAVSGSIARPGYDYHGTDRGTTTAADKNLFDLVLRLLQTLDYYQKPGVIQLTTDGACYGQGITSVFPGDSNNICCAHLLVYSPTPLNFATRSGGILETQIGQFTSGIITDQTPAASSERGIALATYINYMSLAGLSSQTATNIASAGLSASQIAGMNLLPS